MRKIVVSLLAGLCLLGAAWAEEPTGSAFCVTCHDEEDMPDMTGTAHGRWLLLKLTLVGGMLGLAALHRWRLVPALAASIRGG